MPATLQEVRTLIRKAFPDANVDEIGEDNGRIVGTIRWNRFRKMSIQDRNRAVTEGVRKPLGLRGTNVGILFPLTQDENL